MHYKHRLMKQKQISAVILLLLTLNCRSQSGWQVGQYYQYRGEETTTCGPVYNITCVDYYNNPYVCGQAQNCRTLHWEQEYYSGYVNLWGAYGWYTQWLQGYYWYCYWEDWTKYL